MSNNDPNNNNNSNKLSIIVGLILIALIIGYIFFYYNQSNIEPSRKIEDNIYEPLVSDLSYETETSIHSSTSSINNNVEPFSASSLS
jgi:hypothetical protein